ncbi:putative Amidohydrolase [Seiridium cardinale]|uniref:Amidohydrolase n=1 Tax=Seiridium cardinale TaxID=138064 RepID=A0ABR2XG24_9PEZI
MQPLSIKRVILPARNNKTSWDVEVKNGAIQTIRPSDQQQTEPEVTSDMLLPALCHPHIHLDKPYILTCNHSPSRHHPDYSDLAPTSGSFGEALANTSEAKKRYTRDDLHMRGAQLLAASYRQGVTSLRAFVEIDHVTDTLALETAIKLKDEFAHLVEVQICAFAQDPIFSGDFGAQNREAIQSALLNFAHAIDVLGTTPYVEKAREAAAENIEWAVKTALANNLHLDFHLDYNLEPSSSLQPLTYTVIDVLQKHQWANEADKSKTIVLGHCTQLSTICASELEDLAEKIKESKLPIHFVGLPTSDLFMMGRPGSGNASSKPHSRPRGTLQVPSLIKNYGLSACLGVNNVGNAFTPFGSGDPLQLASWGVGIYQAGTVDDASVLYSCVSWRARIAIGLEVLHDDGDIAEGDNWHPMLLVKNEQSLSLPAKFGDTSMAVRAKPRFDFKDMVWDPPETQSRSIIGRLPKQSSE